MTRGKLQIFVVMLVLAAIALNAYFVFVLTNDNDQHHGESSKRFTQIERLIERRNGEIP